MLQIPSNILKSYTSFIDQKGVKAERHRYYLRWLRYYLDFCHKYDVEISSHTSLGPFLEKLRDKKQDQGLVDQAKYAISLFYEMPCNLSTKDSKNTAIKPSQPVNNNSSDDQSFNTKISMNNQAVSPYYSLPKNSKTHSTNRNASSPKVKPKHEGTDWTETFTELKNAIKVRHYSPKTLKTYSGWVRKFQTYTKSKDPLLISVDDVKSFLTWLAVKQGVAASSQNQAFNALLFLFRNVFKQDFGKVDGIVRAKRKPYIPVVLSRQEVDTIIGILDYPFKLIISLMYGCGLRISECLSLRVQNFNFDMKVLTIHDGKGKKDRTVPIPEILMDALKAQLEKVTDLHDQDCQASYNGVFLYGLLEKKYKNAARELIWQWFFPAKELTIVPENQERRRYHIHETALQKALRKAVKKAKIPKRVTPHTFRHSFASHLLQANYDIRTIQELLGHSDVRTTMIYTHTVKSQTLKEAKSPLDF